VQITSSVPRKVVAFHVLSALVFNIGVMAFVINELGAGLEDADLRSASHAWSGRWMGRQALLSRVRVRSSRTFARR
jgi:hypothetical protein